MRLGLDIDGVLADFPAAVIERARKMRLGDHFPADAASVDHWNMSERFADVMKDAWESKLFWLGVPSIEESLPPWQFDPICYITSRPIDSDTTELWLALHGFPPAPVITVACPEDKLIHVQEQGLDYFVDDYYPTVEMLIANGENGILFAAPYQIGHSVSHLPTIQRLEELNEY